LLRSGEDAIREVPPDRFDQHAFYDPDPAAPGKMNTRWGGFLDGVDQFDPHFFGISPREAARMDPQQRLLLEVPWEALQDAGQVPEHLAGSPTGVFIGIATNDYGRLQWNDLDRIDAYAGTGNALSIAANRISYLLDFRGPSLAIDTACSSSLVAVHLACCSLRNGESTLALAGGVNLILSPAIAINFTKAGAMAPDGRCKAFDARANGYVRSEGAGVVVLKPLSRALADGDPIHAVIRGSAVNQDGRSNGLMAPNPLAQEAVLREAYRQAAVSPGKIRYIEAHGTGTLLGDPIEARALGAVLGVERPPGQLARSDRSRPIWPPRAAAGIAVIKVEVVARHARYREPAFQNPNPHIPLTSFRCGRRHWGHGRLGRNRHWPGSAHSASAGPTLIWFSKRRPGSRRLRRRRSRHRRTAAAPVGSSPEASSRSRAPIRISLPCRGRGILAGYLLHTSLWRASPRPPPRRSRQFAGTTRGEPGSLLLGEARPGCRRVESLRAPAKARLRVSGPGVNGSAWGGAVGAGNVVREVLECATKQCDPTEIGRCSPSLGLAMPPGRD
jgi:3-oxoacyl-(acyl-carrier-protein) synthase